jgi:hypothetical protein
MNRSVVRWVLLSLVVMSFSAASFGQIAVGVSVRIGPPALPVYAQPICPGPGYLWTPGYWGWNDDDGYYWVPGTWVVAPVGLLWTPGYWGWGGGFYLWHPGYWVPHIGFYGGINYGFGYTGVGFVGGEWRGGAFFYNRSVTNVSVTNVTNVYNRTVVVNENHVAYNGGAGGVQAHATEREEAFARERHTPALASQTEHEHMASKNRENFASQNHGRPAIAATSRPGDFSRHSAVSARAAGAEYHAPAMSPKEARAGSSAGNHGGSSAGNRGGSNAGNHGGSNDGFRSFSPPAKGGNSNAGGRNENAGRGNESRYNESRSNENRPSENRSTENRNNQSRSNESRPQNQSRGASQPRENYSRPASQPKHQNAPPPREEKRHGR